MQVIRPPMPSHAHLNRESASQESDPIIPAPRSGRLAIRDHRDDGSLVGGLIIMLLVALPLWAMVIILVGLLF